MTSLRSLCSRSHPANSNLTKLLILLFLVFQHDDYKVFGFSLSFSGRSTTRSTSTFSSTFLHATRTRTVKEEDTCDIAILGGGFGGLYTAFALSRLCRNSKQQTLDIVLVDPSDQFVFLPLLYDLTMGTATEKEVCPYYQDLLTTTTGIRHVQGRFHNFLSSSSSSSKKEEGFVANITTTTATKTLHLSCRYGSVIAVGATPTSTLNTIQGAKEYTQPYYTKEHALQTKKILNQIESKLKLLKKKKNPTTITITTPIIHIAIIGGGYAGVELAACIQRRFLSYYDSTTTTTTKTSTSRNKNKKQKMVHVTLFTRNGRPMKGTKAETVIANELKSLGVSIVMGTIESIEKDTTTDKIKIHTTKDNNNNNNQKEENQTLWDAVLWTAGSGPAYPIGNLNPNTQTSKIDSLFQKGNESNCLAVDSTLRCLWKDPSKQSSQQPPVWALGDCTEMIPTTSSSSSSSSSSSYAVPKTAQAAIQQAEIVARNIFQSQIVQEKNIPLKNFEYLDLGSMLSLGGPNAAWIAPAKDSTPGTILNPLVDTAKLGFTLADQILGQLLETSSPTTKEMVQTLGLRLGGGYGLSSSLSGSTIRNDNDDETEDRSSSSGILTGTLTGAIRRTIYAARMPTNEQRLYSLLSSTLLTTSTVVNEIIDYQQKKKMKSKKEDIKNE